LREDERHVHGHEDDRDAEKYGTQRGGEVTSAVFAILPHRQSRCHGNAARLAYSEACDRRAYKHGQSGAMSIQILFAAKKTPGECGMYHCAEETASYTVRCGEATVVAIVCSQTLRVDGSQHAETCASQSCTYEQGCIGVAEDIANARADYDDDGDEEKGVTAGREVCVKPARRRDGGKDKEDL
jgi:hypothetical protein